MSQQYAFLRVNTRADKGRITPMKDLESGRFELQPFVRANGGNVDVIGFYEGVEELCHWWKYGDMNK